MASDAEIKMDVRTAQEFINLMVTIAEIDNQQARIHSSDLFPDKLQRVILSGKWDDATHKQALRITQFLQGKTPEQLEAMIRENNDGKSPGFFSQLLLTDPEDRDEFFGKLWRYVSGGNNEITEEGIKRFLDLHQDFVALTIKNSDLRTPNSPILAMKGFLNSAYGATEGGPLLLNEDVTDPNFALKLRHATAQVQQELVNSGRNDIAVTGIWDDKTQQALKTIHENAVKLGSIPPEALSNLSEEEKKMLQRSFFYQARQTLPAEQVAVAEEALVKQMQTYINLVAEISDIDEWQVRFFDDPNFPTDLKPVTITGKWDEETKEQAKKLHEFLSKNDDAKLQSFVDEINLGAEGVERLVGPLSSSRIIETFKETFSSESSYVTGYGRTALLASNETFLQVYAYKTAEQNAPDATVVPTGVTITEGRVDDDRGAETDGDPEAEGDSSIPKITLSADEIAALEKNIRAALIETTNKPFTEHAQYYRDNSVTFQGTPETFKLGGETKEGLSHNRATWTILHDIITEKHTELLNHDQELSRRQDIWLDNKKQWQERLEKTQETQESIAAQLGKKDEILESLRKTGNAKDLKPSDIQGIDPKHKPDDVSDLIVQMINLEQQRRSLEQSLIEPEFRSIFGYDRGDAEAKIQHYISLRDAIGGVIGHGPAPTLGDTPDPNRKTIELRVYDRFFSPDIYKEIAKQARELSADEYAAFRRELGKQALDRMIEQAAERGIPKDQITAAMMGRFKNASGHTVYFNPHQDDLRLAYEGLPLPDGYDVPLIEDAQTASYRNNAWATLMGGLSEEEHFRKVQRSRSQIPDDITLAQAKADPKLWAYTQEQMAISRKHGDGAFAMVRLSSANPDDTHDFNKEYEQRRVLSLNQQAAEQAAALASDAHGLSQTMNSAASGQTGTTDPKAGDDKPGQDVSDPKVTDEPEI